MKVILQYFTTFITFCILATSYYAYSLKSQQSLKFIDIYLLVLLTVAFIIVFLNSFKKINFQSIKLKKIKMAVVLLNIAFIFFSVFSKINSESLSRDELTQIELSKDRSPLEACSLQSQPPLSCALSKVSSNLFATTETGSRLHVAAASFFSSLFILFISFNLIENFILASALAWLFSLHPILVQYGYEVRPISLAVLLCSILFSNLVIMVKSDSSFETQNTLQVSAIAFIFLNTVGLQPVILVANLFVIFLCSFIFFKNRKLLYLAISFFIALLLYLPIQFEILHSSEVAFGPVYFFTENLLKLTEIVHEDFVQLFLKLGGLVSLLSAVFILYQGYIKKSWSSDFKVFIGLFLYSTSTYVLLRVFFKLFIFFKMHDRYLFTLWVPFIITLAYLIRQISLEKSKLPNHIFSFSVSALFILISFATVQKLNFIVNRFDQKNVFSWINKNLTANDRVIMKCLPNTEGFCFSLDENLKSASFYFNPQEQVHLDFSENSIYSFLNLYKSEENFDRLFVIIERSDGENIKIPHPENFEIVHLKNESILVLSGGKKSILAQWKKLIDSFETKDQDQNKILFQEKIQNALASSNFDLYSVLAYEFILNNSEYDDLAFINKFKAKELLFFGRNLF